MRRGNGRLLCQKPGYLIIGWLTTCTFTSVIPLVGLLGEGHHFGGRSYKMRPMSGTAASHRIASHQLPETPKSEPSRVLDLEAALEGLGAGILERYPHRRLASFLGVHGTERLLETLLRLRGLPECTEHDIFEGRGGGEGGGAAGGDGLSSLLRAG